MHRMIAISLFIALSCCTHDIEVPHSYHVAPYEGLYVGKYIVTSSEVSAAFTFTNTFNEDVCLYRDVIKDDSVMKYILLKQPNERRFPYSVLGFIAEQDLVKIRVSPGQSMQMRTTVILSDTRGQNLKLAKMAIFVRTAACHTGDGLTLRSAWLPVDKSWQR